MFEQYTSVLISAVRESIDSYRNKKQSEEPDRNPKRK
jgi:hypothetical protein